MKIKKLELHGFKSFVDPTGIDFDLPIIGVVGPNGCGKSNVVDAIRWVMGEQSAKHLRGKSMEDVIFSGTDKRAPLGMASVSLTFSTEDGIVPPQYATYSEITIMRRLYRSGESEYLINKVPCRLRDILDLFLGTGAGTKAYSVIEQGQIDFAINAKPEDRRRMIEEAAGISKFKVRRDMALRKMESTQNNLLRLGDILNEVHRQIRSLERQVKKAERYRKHRDELRDLELHFSSVRYLEKQQELTELKALSEQWQEKETASEVSLATVETDIERRRVEMSEEEQKLSTMQEKIFEQTNRLQLARTEKDYKEKESAGLEEQSTRWTTEIEEAKERLRFVSSELEDKQQRGDSIEEQSEEAAGQLEAAETSWVIANERREQEGRRLESCREEVARLGTVLSTIASQLAALEQGQIGLQGRSGKNEAEQAEIRSQQEQVQRLIGSLEKELSDLSHHHAATSERLNKMMWDLKDGHRRREEQEYELRSLQEELMDKRSRLRSLVDLEKNFEGYAEGVRSVLKVKKTEGVYGVVADFVESTPQYEPALSAALGEKLQYIVVESHQEGVEAIDYLKAKSSGRSSFIPVGVRTSEDEPFPCDGDGILGPLLDFVKVKGRFQNVGHYLFGDVILVENLHRALDLWRSNGHKKRFVTLDGEVVDTYGVVSGGCHGTQSGSVLTKRREIEYLRDEVIKLEQEVGLREDSVSHLEGNLSGVDLEKRQVEQTLQGLEVKKASLEKDLFHQREVEKRYSERLSNLSREQEEIETEIQTNRSQQDEARRHQDESKRKQSELQREFHEIQAAMALAEQESQRYSEKLTDAKVRTSSVKERHDSYHNDLQRLCGLKTELEERISGRMHELTEANQRMAGLSEEVKGLSEQIETLQSEVDVLKQQWAEAKEFFDGKSTDLREDELKVRTVRKEVDLAREHISNLKVTLTRLEADIGHLEEQIAEKYSLSLEEVASVWAEKTIEIENIEARIAELREKLDKMGDVNLGAIPEFENLREREEFLTQQYEDLETALTKLKQVIRKINQTTRERFEETFRLVQEKFAALFPRLFKGGKAELRLEDPQDLLNTGVQLMIQPPGKRLSQVSLLSGGEKALAAVAFVFSIFLVKPSPFCILDEVDAPLDDANVKRFHRLIQDMTDRTQFILITHNKLTMEMVDGLYGVTMQELGVSKVVSVKLGDIPETPHAVNA